MASIQPGKDVTASVIAAPVEVLPTDFAKVYTHVHPVLVLSLLYLSFGSVVDDPVSNLGKVLVALSILQATYCIICLPASSSTVSATIPPSPSAKSPGNAAAAKRKAAGSSKPTTTTAKLTSSAIATVLSLVVVPPIFFIVLVLHGAPLTTHHLHTAMLALHISVLSAPGLFYVHGVSAARWKALVSLSAPVDEVLGGAIGACVGAWLGAIPIPLDWDREWQKWPVTVVAGSYAGWAVGRFMGGYVFKGRKIDFSDR